MLPVYHTPAPKATHPEKSPVEFSRTVCYNTPRNPKGMVDLIRILFLCHGRILPIWKK